LANQKGEKAVALYPPYSYVAGPNTLGIGVGNMALVRPMPPIYGGFPYGQKYNVRGSINPFEGAAQFPAPFNYGPKVDLRADGVYLSEGTIALAALADLNQKAAK